MGLFNRKTKEQKIIEEMKQKKAQIDKLKEEMNNMAKLVLKDGKLQKVEDTPKIEPKEETLPPPPPPPPMFNRNAQQEMENELREQRFHHQQQQKRFAEQQYMREQEEMLRQQQYQQPILPPIPPPSMYQQPPQYQQPMYQQPMYQQPMYQQPIPEVNIQLNIEMTNATVIKLAIPSSRYDKFVVELENAINEQTTLTLNNRVINGRNVVSYYVE